MDQARDSPAHFVDGHRERVSKFSISVYCDLLGTVPRAPNEFFFRLRETEDRQSVAVARWECQLLSPRLSRVVMP